MEENRLEKARDYEAKYGSRITEEERPVFHVTPTVGWLNDQPLFDALGFYALGAFGLRGYAELEKTAGGACA